MNINRRHFIFGLAAAMTLANGTGHGIPLCRLGDCNGWVVKA